MKTLAALVLLVALAGCAHTAAEPVADESFAPQPVGTAGIYDLDFGQFTGVYALLDDGRFYGLHFLGDTLAGHPYGQLSEGDTATTPEPIAWANFVDDGRRLGTMEASGVFGRRFVDEQLTAAISGSMGSFSAKAGAQKPWHEGSAQSLYGDPVESVAGEFAGIVRSVGLELKKEDVTSFVIDDDGSFTVTAVQCEFAGSLTQYENTGLFEVEATAIGADCAVRGALRGVVVPLSVDGDHVQFAVELSTDDATQSVVFIVER